MAESKQEIIPSVGINNINFSMPQNELKTILGNPAYIDDSIIEQPVYYYDEIGLAIVFEWIDGHYKTHSFEIDKDLYTLWNVSIIGQTYETIIQLLKDSGVKDYVEYTSNSTSRVIMCKGANLSFSLENGVVDSLTLYNSALA